MSISSAATVSDSPAAGAPPLRMEDRSEVILVGKLIPSPTNPRKHFDEQKLADLADSIKSHGVLQHLIVRATNAGGKVAAYEIVAGERRWRAAQKAGLSRVPCIVRDLSDDQVLEIQTIENLQREDVHPIEEAAGYQALIDRGIYDVPALAAKVGKSAGYVYGRLKLLSLIEPARTALADPDSKFTMAHATIVARLPRPEDQQACLDFILKHWKAVKPEELRGFIEQNLLRVLAEAPFPLDDSMLVAGSAACLACLKRTGAQSVLFVDVVDEKDRCLDVPCYEEKVRNWLERKRQSHSGKDGEKALLVSPSYAKAGRGGGILNLSEFGLVKKVTPGAVPAVVASGPDIGKSVWVKVHRKPAAGGKNSAVAVERDRARRAEQMKLGKAIVTQFAGELVRLLLDDKKLIQLKSIWRFVMEQVSQSLYGQRLVDALAILDPSTPAAAAGKKSNNQNAGVREAQERLLALAAGASPAELPRLLARVAVLAACPDEYSSVPEHAKDLIEIAREAGIAVDLVLERATAAAKAAVKGEAGVDATSEKAAAGKSGKKKAKAAPVAAVAAVKKKSKPTAAVKKPGGKKK